MPPESIPQTETTEVHQPLRVLHQVTPFSKYLAMLLFVSLPFLGGYIGYTLAPEQMVEVERVVVVEKQSESVTAATSTPELMNTLAAPEACIHEFYLGSYYYESDTVLGVVCYRTSVLSGFDLTSLQPLELPAGLQITTTLSASTSTDPFNPLGSVPFDYRFAFDEDNLFFEGIPADATFVSVQKLTGADGGIGLVTIDEIKFQTRYTGMTTAVLERVE